MIIPKYNPFLIASLAIFMQTLPAFSQPNGLYEGGRGDLVCIKGDSIFCRISFPGGLTTYHCVVGTFEKDGSTLKIKHQDFAPLTYELQKGVAPDSLVGFKIAGPHNEDMNLGTLLTLELLTSKRLLKGKKHTFSSFVNEEGEAQFHVGPIFHQFPITKATIKVRNVSYAVDIPVEPLLGIGYEIRKLVPYPYNSRLDSAGETILTLVEWDYDKIRIRFSSLDKVVELARKDSCYSFSECIYLN